MRKAFTIAAIGTVAALALTGCSVADPDTSQVVLHYSGGPFSNQAFVACVPPGVRSVNSMNEQYFYYPHGQRVFTFRSNPDGSIYPGAAETAITVGTKNNVQMSVQGSITFTLNESCNPYTDTQGARWPGGILQKFHDTIGKQNRAYAENGGDEPPAGWDTVLDNFLGQPAQKAMTEASSQFNWQDLYSNNIARTQWVAQVAKDIPALIDQQAGDRFFIITNVQLSQPIPPQDLIDSLTGLQAATVRQQTGQVDQSAAVNFPGGIQGYLEYQQKLAVNKAITDGKVQVLPVPMGSSIIVSAGR